MQKMMKTKTIAGVAALALAAALPLEALAQQAPRRTTVVNNAEASSVEVSLTVKGADAAQYLTVKASNADVRDVFREMGQRSGSTVLIAPSAAGRVTANIQQEPVDKAMSAAAAAAGLSVLRIVVSEDQAARLTPETAGILSESLTAMPTRASMTDPSSGRTLTVADKTDVAAAIPSGFTVVYYLQGLLTPEQERLARERKTVEQVVKAAETVDPKQMDAVGAAVNTLSRLPVQQRMEAMRNMQRQMWEGMSEQDRNEMRRNMRDQGRQRRPGGDQGRR